MLLSRRTVLLAAPAGFAGVALAQGAPPAPAGPHAWFPSHDPELVRKAVGFSHTNLAGLRDLVEPVPELAKASWDWSFGDWESCIDAASHVGNREIAEYLIEKGARPTLFTWAMLGSLEAVKAIIDASPGIQRTLGPHGITLLAHARAGGERSKAVAEHLTRLGDADRGYDARPLSESEEAIYAGAYSFGPGDRDQFVFKRGTMGFCVERPGGVPRRLAYLGDHAFLPAGAASVRLRFTIEGARATAVTLCDPKPSLTAARV